MLLSANLQDNIINKISDIINTNDVVWNNLELNIKLKFIHHYCNYFVNDKNTNWNIISIPLKNIKPKKLIQFAGFNKQTNCSLFNEYNKITLNL